MSKCRIKNNMKYGFEFKSSLIVELIKREMMMGVVWPSARARPGGFTEGRCQMTAPPPKGAQHQWHYAKNMALWHK